MFIHELQNDYLGFEVNFLNERYIGKMNNLLNLPGDSGK